MRGPLPLPTPDQPGRVGAGTGPAEQWSASQAAAVAAAEAIAATAAAEVAAEAAATARAAVEVASAAAVKAAAKASDVAAQAVQAAAAAVETPGEMPVGKQPNVDRTVAIRAGAFLPPGGVTGATAGAALSHDAMVKATAVAATTAAAKVALCVGVVAAAAAAAAVEAATLIGEQLEKDVTAAAVAVAVAAATAHPFLTEHAGTLTPSCQATQADRTDHASRTTVPVGPGWLVLAKQLRHGIDANQLRLHYQPIMNLATGQPVGVEALVRWQHPDRGLLGPSEFIDVAERTGLVVPLGEWVLHEACQFAARLRTREGDPLTVAVNLSGRQLSDRRLVATVRAALAAHGCDAEQLVFEVTETALVTDMVAAIESLRELQDLGAGVAIDDFGTGYASLLYLQQLTANDLKIDRSFISRLGGDSYDTAIVASLITLAHNLNVRCVAEGVETVEQLELLKQLGCDFAQGYLFSRPIDAQTLDAWLDRHLTSATHSPPAPARLSPEKARIVAMHENNASGRTIAAALNADGSHTAHGRRWSAHSVAQTLARGTP